MDFSEHLISVIKKYVDSYTENGFNVDGNYVLYLKNIIYEQSKINGVELVSTAYSHNNEYAFIVFLNSPSFKRLIIKIPNCTLESYNYNKTDIELLQHIQKGLKSDEDNRIIKDIIQKIEKILEHDNSN